MCTLYTNDYGMYWVEQHALNPIKHGQIWNKKYSIPQKTPGTLVIKLASLAEKLSGHPHVLCHSY